MYQLVVTAAAMVVVIVVRLTEAAEGNSNFEILLVQVELKTSQSKHMVPRAPIRGAIE
jgi:hypothetical protein